MTLLVLHKSQCFKAYFSLNTICQYFRVFFFGLENNNDYPTSNAVICIKSPTSTYLILLIQFKIQLNKQKISVHVNYNFTNKI